MYSKVNNKEYKNIPEYRAELIEQNIDNKVEDIRQINGIWYAIGFLLPNNQIFIKSLNDSLSIKEETLAIRFQEMFDSKNKKIFASLSLNGIGGDIIKYEHPNRFVDIETIVYYENGCIEVDEFELCSIAYSSEVINIKQKEV